MIVHTDYGRVLLTAHAIERYRSRIDRRADAGTIAEALWKSRVQAQRPGFAGETVQPDSGADLWLVGPAGAWCIPLRLPDPKVDRNAATFDYAALTVIKRRTVSKAEVRARREQARDDAWAA